MQSLAAVAKAVTVVAAVDDVQQAAGRARVGIVVHREQPPEHVERHVERVPEPGGDSLELGPVGLAAVDVAPFAAAGERCPIVADQPVIGTQVLAQAEIDLARIVECEARQAVVGIVALRVEPDDRRGKLAVDGAVGPAVADRGLRGGRARFGSRRRPSRRGRRPRSSSSGCPQRTCRCIPACRRGLDPRRLESDPPAVPDNPAGRKCVWLSTTRMRPRLVDRDPRGRDDLAARRRSARTPAANRATEGVKVPRQPPLPTLLIKPRSQNRGLALDHNRFSKSLLPGERGG